MSILGGNPSLILFLLGLLFLIYIFLGFLFFIHQLLDDLSVWVGQDDCINDLDFFLENQNIA